MLDKNINLITRKDSEELFLIQEEILKKIEYEKNADNIIRLALLQTMTPIEDYEEAVKILESVASEYDDVNIKLIGAYLSSEWVFDRDNYYLKELNKELDSFEPDIQAIIYFLNATHANIQWTSYSKDEKKQYIMSQLEKSIELDKTLVSSFRLLAQYCVRKDRKRLLLTAKSNVKEVLSIEEIYKLDVYHFIEPTAFINEFIKQTSMSSGSYREHFR